FPSPLIRRRSKQFRTTHPKPTERRRNDMSTVEVIAAPRKTETDNPLVQEIVLGEIKPSKSNPRRRTDDSAMAELASSIKTHGVLQAILVRPVTARAFEIVCGERRWRSSKTAGKETFQPSLLTSPMSKPLI